MPSRSLAARLALLGALIAGGAVVSARAPTLSIGGTTVRTGFLAGTVAGVLLVPSVVTHYRSGERRQALRWGLFAVGIPLSLSGRAPLSWVGVLAVVLSVGVALEVDGRLSERFSV